MKEIASELVKLAKEVISAGPVSFEIRSPSQGKWQIIAKLSPAHGEDFDDCATVCQTAARKMTKIHTALINTSNKLNTEEKIEDSITCGTHWSYDSQEKAFVNILSFTIEGSTLPDWVVAILESFGVKGY